MLSHNQIIYALCMWYIPVCKPYVSMARFSPCVLCTLQVKPEKKKEKEKECVMYILNTQLNKKGKRNKDRQSENQVLISLRRPSTASSF